MPSKKPKASPIPEHLRHPAVLEVYPPPYGPPEVNPYSMPKEEMFEILRKAKILTKKGKLTKAFR